MNNLTDEEKQFLAEVDARHKRQAQFPLDMGFYPFSNKFAEGVELKAPWLAEYYSYRDSCEYHYLQTQKQTSRQELLDWQREHGADASDKLDRYRGALLGLMLGDTLGVPLEFSKRDAMTVTDIVGGGPFGLQPGYWTDDTSMACCLAYSLIKCRGFAACHQMESYSYWYRYGAFSPTNTCFDIGNTTRQALENFLSTGQVYAGSTDPRSAGNGSLMRLAPVVLFFSDDFEQAIHYAAESSRTTHGALEAIDACRYFAALIYGALHGVPKDQLLSELYSPLPGYWQSHPLCPGVEAIARGRYKQKQRHQISSSGYVIHTLEAALWAFYRNEDFRSGVLEAVNLADDSDTVGAVYGQLAGAFYGETQIPMHWINHTHASHGCYHFAQDIYQVQQSNRG